MKTLGEDVSPPQPRGCEWMIRLLSSFHAFISIRYEVLISPPLSSKCDSLERKLRLISRRLSCAFLHAAARCTLSFSLHLPSPLARISLSFVLMTEEGERVGRCILILSAHAQRLFSLQSASPGLISWKIRLLEHSNKSLNKWNESS